MANAKAQAVQLPESEKSTEAKSTIQSQKESKGQRLYGSQY